MAFLYTFELARLIERNRHVKNVDVRSKQNVHSRNARFSTSNRNFIPVIEFMGGCVRCVANVFCGWVETSETEMEWE